MEARKTAPPRTPSRTAAIVAVALLLTIAIAGFVLATLRHRSAPADAAEDASTQASGAAPTAEVDVAPNEVLFAAESDKLSGNDVAKMTRLADKAKGENRLVIVTGKVEANHPPELDLTRRRTSNVRTALLSSGVPLTMLRIEISQFPAGLLPPRAVHRVEVVMRDR